MTKAISLLLGVLIAIILLQLALGQALAITVVPGGDGTQGTAQRSP